MPKKIPSNTNLPGPYSGVFTITPDPKIIKNKGTKNET